MKLYNLSLRFMRLFTIILLAILFGAAINYAFDGLIAGWAIQHKP